MSQVETETLTQILWGAALSRAVCVIGELGITWAAMGYSKSTTTASLTVQHFHIPAQFHYTDDSGDKRCQGQTNIKVLRADHVGSLYGLLRVMRRCADQIFQKPIPPERIQAEMREKL